MRCSNAILVPSSPPSTPKLGLRTCHNGDNITINTMCAIGNSFESQVTMDIDADLPSIDTILGKSSSNLTKLVGTQMNFSKGFTTASKILKEKQNQGIQRLAKEASHQSGGIKKKRLDVKTREKLPHQPTHCKEETETESRSAQCKPKKSKTANKKNSESSRFFPKQTHQKDCRRDVGEHVEGAAAANADSDITKSKKTKTKTKRAKAPATANAESSTTNHEATAKRRSKKRPQRESNTEPNEQPKISKPKVTKPDHSQLKRKSAEALDKKANDEAQDQPEESNRDQIEVEPLGLEQAVARRKDWTPTKQQCKVLVHETSDTRSVSSDQAVDQHLGSVIDSFTYEDLSHKTIGRPVVAMITPNSTRDGMFKKRKIELINLTGSSCEGKSKAKTKSSIPKKKPQTVTNKATELYQSAASAEGPCLLNYFSSLSDVGISRPSHEMGSDLSFPTSTGRTGKPPKERSRVHPSTLLPEPELALQAAKAQDIVFGTSSQLARESSPSVIRDLQTALQNSEVELQQSMSAVPHAFRDPRTMLGSVEQILGIRPTGQLWSAAARNINGSLHDPEVIGLSNVQTLQKRDQNRPHDQNTEPELIPSPDVPRTQDNSFQLINDLPLLTKPYENVSPIGRLPTPDPSIPEILVPSVSLHVSLAESALRNRPRPKSTSHVKKKPGRPKKDMSDDNFPGPKFEDYSLEQLKQEVSTYGLGWKRSRIRMIEELRGCWQEKQRVAALPSATAVPASNEVTTKGAERPEPGVEMLLVNGRQKAPQLKPTEKDSPTKRKRGRPRKTSETNLANTIDPRPPSVIQPNTESQVATLSQSSPEVPTEDHTVLISSIHRAILAQPPTHSIKNPSWREKMALYDPIILEDLTTWLNTEGLDAVGCDEEVWPALVRDWCENKSVCFYWRKERERRALARG